MIIKVIKEVPDTVFNDCISELSFVDWTKIFDDRKKGVFKTSTSIHLRSHDTLGKTPTSIKEFSELTDCVDNKFLVSQFSKNYQAALWIKDQVNGIELGRVMIVHLEPRGKIGIHIDPGPYFKKYSRFHIPLQTNPSVYFFNEHEHKEHMPIQTLCRLNNLSNHGLINDSDEERIHLIVDVETPEGNSTF
jgi:hypothetical protein